MIRFILIFLLISFAAIGATTTAYVNGTVVNTGAAGVIGASTIEITHGLVEADIVGCGIHTSNGTGYAHQNSREITGYVPATGIATINAAWTTSYYPTAGDTYVVTLGSDLNTGSANTKDNAWATINRCSTSIPAESTYIVEVEPAVYAEPTNGYVQFNSNLSTKTTTVRKNPASVGTVVVAPSAVVRGFLFYNSLTNANITIQNMSVIPVTYVANAVEVDCTGGTVVVDNITIYNVSETQYSYGVNRYAGVERTFDLEVKNCTIESGTCAYKNGGGYANSIGTNYIHHNTFKTTRSTGSVSYIVELGVEGNPNTYTTATNRLEYNTLSFGGTNYGHGILIGVGADNTIFRYNTIRGGNPGIALKCTGAYVEYNTIQTLGGTQYAITPKGCVNCYVRYNVCYGASTGAQLAMQYNTNASYPATGNTITNNVFYTSSAVVAWTLTNAECINNFIDYNCYYTTNSNICTMAGANKTTMLAVRLGWDAYTGSTRNDHHSVFRDPVIVADVPTDATTLALMSTTATATTTYYVDPVNGNDTNYDGGTVAEAEKTILAAIADCADGDTVKLVDTGSEYPNETLTLAAAHDDKSITVESNTTKVILNSDTTAHIYATVDNPGYRITWKNINFDATNLATDKRFILYAASCDWAFTFEDCDFTGNTIQPLITATTTATVNQLRDVHLKNCTYSSSGVTPFYIVGFDQLEIDGGTYNFTNTTATIVISSTSTGTIRKIIVQNATIYGVPTFYQEGGAAFRNTEFVFRNNIYRQTSLLRSTYIGYFVGEYLDRNIIFENNDIQCTDTTSEYGFLPIAGSSTYTASVLTKGTRIVNNYIKTLQTNYVGTAIQLGTGFPSSIVTDNRIHGFLYGIRASGDSHIILNNTVNCAEPLIINGTRYATIQNNTIKSYEVAANGTAAWSATTYLKGAFVTVDGVFYKALSNTLATDVPGVSSKWQVWLYHGPVGVDGRSLLFNRNEYSGYTDSTPTFGSNYVTSDTAWVLTKVEPGMIAMVKDSTASSGFTHWGVVTGTEVLTLDVAPTTAWTVGTVITGTTSAVTSIVRQQLSATTYVISDRTGAYTLGEVIGVTGNTADQGAENPTTTTTANKLYVTEWRERATETVATPTTGYVNINRWSEFNKCDHNIFDSSESLYCINYDFNVRHGWNLVDYNCYVAGTKPSITNLGYGNYVGGVTWDMLTTLTEMQARWAGWPSYAPYQDNTMVELNDLNSVETSPGLSGPDEDGKFMVNNAALIAKSIGANLISEKPKMKVTGN